MNEVYVVKKDGTFVAIFERPSDAYTLRDEKRDELPDSCYVTVEEHALFESLQDRNRLGP